MMETFTILASAPSAFRVRTRRQEGEDGTEATIRRCLKAEVGLLVSVKEGVEQDICPVTALKKPKAGGAANEYILGGTKE